jgi:hypothetical protein
MAIEDLIAQGIRPPQVEDPTTTYGKLLAIQNQRQQQQLGAQQLQSGSLELQDKQRQMAQTQAVNNAYRSALTIKPDGTPDIDTGQLSNALATGGHGSAIPGIIKGINDYKKSSADLSEAQGKVAVLEQDAGGSLAATVKAGNNDPNLFLTLAQHAVDSKHVDAATVAPLIQQVQTAQQQDPTGNAARALVGQISDRLLAGSPAQQKLANERMTAQGSLERGDAAKGELGLRQDAAPTANALAAETLAKTQRENAGNQIAMALEAEPTQPGTYQRVFRGLSPAMQATFANAKTPADARRLAMTPDQVVTTDQAAQREADAEKDRKVTQGFERQKIGIAQGTQEIERAKADPFGALGLNQHPIAGGPQGANMSGAPYLATLPPPMQTRVQAIAEGRETLSAREKGSPQGQTLQTAVEQYDPGWSEQRAQLRKAFTTGPDGRNIGNLNTAPVHLAALAEAGKAMQNGSFVPGNQLYNTISTMFGGTAPTDFNGMKTVVAGEMAAAMKGNATDPEIASFNKSVQDASSPGQLAGVIGNAFLPALAAKLNTYDERYHQQSSPTDQWSPVLPSARAVFQRYGINPLTRTAPNPAAAPQFKIGDTVNYQGVPHKVKDIVNGKLVLEN